MHIDQIYGSLLGLVLADAIGARFEGLPPEQLHRSVDSPSAAFAYSIGRDSLRYTDDGQMALVVAEYLTNHESIHWDELMDDFVAAYEPWRGYGRGARALLESFYDRENYEFKAQHLFPGGSLGNGAAMRSAPIGLRFFDDLEKVWQEAKESAWPTHRHELGIEGAQLIAVSTSIAATASTITPVDLANTLIPFCQTTVFQNRLNLLAEVKTLNDIGQFGNGIEAHESVVTALACFALYPNDYRQAISTAIWQGGDTDTIGAMTGALVGARIGSTFTADLNLTRLESGAPFLAHLQDIAKRLSSSNR